MRLTSLDIVGTSILLSDDHVRTLPFFLDGSLDRPLSVSYFFDHPAFYKTNTKMKNILDSRKCRFLSEKWSKLEKISNFSPRR
jgi:hypothetical protein